MPTLQRVYVESIQRCVLTRDGQDDLTETPTEPWVGQDLAYYLIDGIPERKDGDIVVTLRNGIEVLYDQHGTGDYVPTERLPDLVFPPGTWEQRWEGTHPNTVCWIRAR